MTDYAAYDMGLPCKNPNCKSHGKIHPNCQCYAGMAEGGEVTHFCMKKGRHEPECEHFADGGSVDEPLHTNPGHSVAAYLSHGGLHNFLKFHEDTSDEALDRYNHHVKRGKKYFDSEIEHLFSGGPVEPKDPSKAKKHIHDWIEKGGLVNDIQDEIYSHNSPETFAEGGKVEERKSKLVHDHKISRAYPEQNLMLQMAKGRMSDYLNSLKPQENTPSLSFDKKPDQKLQKKSYEKALHIAAHPMSILEKMHKGNLEPEDLHHFKSLHPEVNEALQEKMTERVIHSQLDGKKPPYKIRQSLSMFLGAPLGSEMTNKNLQAIQATFQQGSPQQEQAPAKNKKNTSTLTKADDSYMTGSEARVARSQRQKA